MRKISVRYLVIFICFLAVNSCKKQSYTFPTENSIESPGVKPESLGGCGVTAYHYYDGIADLHLTDNFEYENGLLENVFTSYGWRYNLEYDAQNRLSGSKVYDGITLLYIISFVYQNNKVVRETWIDATTLDVFDDIFITYNEQGRMIRNESFPLEYYVTYTYTENGSLESWTFFIAGLPVTKAEYTYDANYKNPLLSLREAEYDFWYGNSGFGIGTGHEWYSSEKVTIYDTDGAPQVYYALDPAQTAWKVGEQHYPLQADYIDMNSPYHITTSFDFQDCNPGQSAKGNLAPKAGNISSKKSKYFKFPFKNAIEKLRGPFDK